MIDEQELWACANLLIQQHGDRAHAKAKKRAAELLAAGAVEGHRTFQRIADRVKQLQSTTTDLLWH